MTPVRYTSGPGSGTRIGRRWFRREKASIARYGARSTMSSNTCRMRIPSTFDGGLFRGTTFLEVDRERRTLWLNKRYRSLFTGDDHGSLNDAPLLKGLLYLLMQEVFKGSYLGPRDKDSIDLWQQVLTAAARAESPMIRDSRYLTDTALDELMASGPKTAFRIPGVPEVHLVFLSGR